MAVVVISYLAWILWSPLNFLFIGRVGAYPGHFGVLVNSIVFAPLMYLFIRWWLRAMTKRKTGPAAGIDVVEASRGVPEEGDEWGQATRPYSKKSPPRIMGPKSVIREAPIGLDGGFFVKMPDLDNGESIFEPDELKTRAMVRSTVSSGGWVRKRVASRGAGSMKAVKSMQSGRPHRSQVPTGEIGSIDIPATIMAAIRRIGKVSAGEQIQIQGEDIREKVYASRTPLTVIIVVDVSMSMKGGMKEVRRVIERIEREIRGSRDRVGIIAFKDSGAIELQAPTTNWNKIYRSLLRLRISGLTPLAEGMMKAFETIKREKMRNIDIEPLVILISDFSPNIPLAQSVGPGHAKYTPVRDLVKAARLFRKNRIRVITINTDINQKKWAKFLKRSYHDALELATLLRMRKEGYDSQIETILAVPEFRQSFGAYIIANASEGRAFLSSEVLNMRSILGDFLSASSRKTRLSKSDLKAIESYLPK